MVEQIPTRKRRKIISRREEIDPTTGEVLEVRVYGVPHEYETNYAKVFNAFTQALLDDDEIMGKAIRLLFWITSQLKMNEIEFFMAYDVVKRDIKVSRSTYHRWKDTLEKKGIIERVSNSIYRINPACIVRGQGKTLLNEWKNKGVENDG